MKRILFVHHTSEIGGGSFCLLNLLKEVDRDRFDPMVLLKNEGPLSEEITKLGIELHYMPMLQTVPYNKRLTAPSSIRMYHKIWKSFGEFHRIMKELCVDILYLNNSMLYPYLKVAKESGIRTVIHIREHWPLHEHRIQLRWFQKGISEYSDKIVAINEFSLSMVPGVEYKKRIIYDWIDFTDRDMPYNLNDLMGEDVSEKKIYLYTGGMQDLKGVCEVLESFSESCGDECRLLAMGVSFPEFKGFRGLVKRLLKSCGYKVPGMRVYDCLKRDSRITAVPMTYQIKNIIEQSYCVSSFFKIPHANLVLAESIILNTPVVAASTPESLEYSLNGELAMLCRFHDVKDFKETISDIDCRRADVMASMAEKSFVIKNKFDRERNAAVFREILESLV